MKKLIQISAFMLLFSSCQKEYTCTCVSDLDGSIVSIAHYDLSQKNAESACKNADEEAGVLARGQEIDSLGEALQTLEASVAEQAAALQESREQNA